MFIQKRRSVDDMMESVHNIDIVVDEYLDTIYVLSIYQVFCNVLI